MCVPGCEIGAAVADAPCLVRVGVGLVSSLLAAGDDSGVTCPLAGVDCLAGDPGGGDAPVLVEGAAAISGTAPRIVIASKVLRS